VKTAKARTRIKHWIRTKERERSISLAKEMLEKEGRKMGVNVAKATRDGRLEALAKEMSFQGVDDLFSAVGYARVTPRQVLNHLVPKPAEEPVEPQQLHAKTDSGREKERPEKLAVSIRGIDDVLVRFAQCCNPLPGDPIIGYISRGRGVTVHTTDCPNVANMEEERLIDVNWESDVKKSFPVKIRMICTNERGVLSQVSKLLAEQQVNIDSGTFRSDLEGRSELIFTIEVNDSTHLYRTIEKLRALKAVYEVVRLTTG
jgi:GTP pyrophosphokinase